MNLTRLKAGMLIVYAGEHCRVLMVNDCRALIQPVLRKERVILPRTGRNAGKVRRFKEPRRMISISPNSEVEIIEPGQPLPFPIQGRTQA